MMVQSVVTLIGLLLIEGNLEVAGAKTINDSPEAREALRRTVNVRFYRSLVISPVEGWIVVRGELAKDHLSDARVIHSELNGKYDSLALELARNLQILNYTEAQSSGRFRGVLVNLLVYRIADGKMVLSFAYFAEAGGNQLAYSGAAWIAVQKANRWVTVEPMHLTPHERRGPRSYTLAVETPGSSRVLGNGHLPMTGMSIQGGQASPMHVSGAR